MIFFVYAVGGGGKAMIYSYHDHLIKYCLRNPVNQLSITNLT